MYDPTVGRWLQPDPEGFDALDPNLERFVGNDPTNATDPSGLEPPKELDSLGHTIKPNIDRAALKTPTIPGAGFQGKFIVSAKAQVGGAKQGNIFVTYEGAQAQDVRWIQLVKLHVRPITATKGTGLFPTTTYTLEPPEEQVSVGNPTQSLGVATIVSSTVQGGAVIYVDVKNGATSPYHHDHTLPGELQNVGSYDPRVAENNSWIADAPDAVQLIGGILFQQRQRMELMNQAQGMPPRNPAIVTHLVTLSFLDIAVSAKTKKAIGIVTWGAYVSLDEVTPARILTVKDAQQPGNTLELQLDKQRHAYVGTNTPQKLTKEDIATLETARWGGDKTLKDWGIDWTLITKP
jgi:hypothetical protein